VWHRWVVPYVPSHTFVCTHVRYISARTRILEYAGNTSPNYNYNLPSCVLTGSYISECTGPGDDGRVCVGCTETCDLGGCVRILSLTHAP
jgi:hypothetical protein